MIINRSERTAPRAKWLWGSLGWFVLCLLIAPFNYAQDSSETYLEDATYRVFNRDYSGALIQVKNALQLTPDHVPALILAGEIHLNLGDPVSAEHVLLQAKKLGADRALINLKLARAFDLQAKYENIINDLSLRNIPPTPRLQLLGYRAQAWTGLGNYKKALAEIERADQIDDTALRHNLARITLFIYTSKLDQALTHAKKLVKQHPDNGDAWNALASVQHAQGKLQLALEHYARAVAIDSDNIDARIARIGLLLDLNREDKAEEDLNFLKNLVPYEPRAAYLRGLIYSRESEQEIDSTLRDQLRNTSRLELKRATQVLAQLPPRKIAADPQLSMVGALAHFSLSEFESAREYLGIYLKKNPSHIGGHRLMGKILLKLEQPLKVISRLKPWLRAYPEDAQLINLMVSAYNQAGLHRKSEQLLRRLLEHDPNNQHTSARLAISQIESGSEDLGIAALTRVFRASPGQTQAGFSLAIVLMQERRPQDAELIARKLLERAPDNLSYQNLHAITLQAAGQSLAASQVFSDIIEAEPDFLPAHINLIKINMALGHYEASREQLETLLSNHPEHPKLLLNKARLERHEGHIEEAIRLLQAILTSHKHEQETRFLLIELYLQTADFSAAENLALEAALFDKKGYAARATLGQVLVKAGKPRQALALYKSMTKEAGFETENLYKIALLEIDIQEYKSAKYTLSKAIEGNPQHLKSKMALIGVQLALHEYTQALKGSRVLLTEHPNNVHVMSLLGQSLMFLSKPQEAEKTYRQILQLRAQPSQNPIPKQQHSSEFLLALYRSLLAQDKRQQGQRLLAQAWQEQLTNQTIKPDYSLGVSYTEHLMFNAQWALAQAALEALIKVYPQRAILLNNMAYTLHQLGHNDALKFAHKAYRIAPTNPQVNDTLGWLLVIDDKAEMALKYLREAVARTSHNQEVRYHLAVALKKLGRDSEAISELELALLNEAPYRDRAAAEKLWQELQP